MPRLLREKAHQGQAGAIVKRIGQVQPAHRRIIATGSPRALVQGAAGCIVTTHYQQKGTPRDLAGADLQAIIDGGRGDVPLIVLWFRCTACGSRLTDSVLKSKDAVRVQREIRRELRCGTQSVVVLQ